MLQQKTDPGQSIDPLGLRLTDCGVQDRTIIAYFLANKNSDVYHRADCKWSKK